MGEERLVIFCLLSVSLSAMLLKASRGCEPEVSLSTALPAVRGGLVEVKIEPLLSSCRMADICQAEGEQRGRVWRLRQVPLGWRGRAPVIVFDNEVCVELSQLDEEAWLDASWLAGLFLLTGECWIMFAAKRALRRILYE